MIKKVFVAALCLGLSALQAQAQLPVEITGSLKKAKKNQVRLFKVSDGKPVELAVYNVSGNGRFGFLFQPEYEGFYLVGTGGATSPGDNYKFYFKGGEKLNLSLLEKDYVLEGKTNSKENMVLKQWHDLVWTIEEKAFNFTRVQSTFVDFFPQLEDIAAKSKTFLNRKTTGNVKFDKLMKDNMKWDLAAYATNFLNTPRGAHPSIEEYSPYYATLKTREFADKAYVAYGQPWGLRILSAMITLNLRQENIKLQGGIEGLKNTLALIPNDTLKGDFVLESAGRNKNYTDYQSVTATYGQYLLTKSQQQKDRDQLVPLVSLKPGEPAFAFSYPDKEGKTVTMADLKGKVVLIDVWATWCGPCKEQIPHLKKLEEEMKGTDLQVVSISVDEAKDKEKWLKMMKDLNLGGIQLFASGWGDLAKYYRITGIPQFIVIDRNGKIINADAPAPSQSRLKPLLEKALAEK